MSKTQNSAPAAGPAPAEWNPPAGAVTYIGPEIPGAAAHMTTFTGGIPEPLLELARERCKALRALIVPTDSIAAKTAACRQPGTAEHTLYEKAEKFAAGEG